MIRRNQVQPQRVLKPSMLKTAAEILGRDSRAAQPTIPEHEATETALGQSRSLFSGRQIEVEQETLEPLRSTGFGCNPTGERFVLVQRGLVFVTSLKDGSQSHAQLSAGQFFVAPSGMRYGIATSGDSDATLLYAQTPGYRAGWVAETAASEVDAGGVDPLIDPGFEMPKSKAQRNLMAERIAQGQVVVQPENVPMPDVSALTAPLDIEPPRPITAARDQLAGM